MTVISDVAGYMYVLLVVINPFTAPACKPSRLSDASTPLQTEYLPVL